MRIGIFGGTFDPVHKGHIRFARAAIKALKLDRIYFVPARISPFKKSAPSANAFHRCSMVEAAIRNKPRFEMSRIEADRKRASYTYLTLRDFRRQFPKAELFLLLGEDALSSFKKWRRWKEILEGVVLVVAHRHRGGKWGKEYHFSKIEDAPLFIHRNSGEIKARRVCRARVSWIRERLYWKKQTLCLKVWRLLSPFIGSDFSFMG